MINEKNQHLDKMHDVGKEKLKYELELMAWQQDCTSLEKTIQQEKYQIEIEQARMKREMQKKFQDELLLQRQMAEQDALRNIQGIERTIHYENQTLTEKTMGQRYLLDFYKREKQRMHTMVKDQERGISLQ